MRIGELESLLLPPNPKLYVCEQIRNRDLNLTVTPAEPGPSNEGRIKYGRATTRHFQGGE
jgi:hypothetical protein